MGRTQGVCLVSVSLLPAWQPGWLPLLIQSLVHSFIYPLSSPWVLAGPQAWSWMLET